MKCRIANLCAGTLTALFGLSSSTGALPQASASYRIYGVVVDGHDRSPIARCRVSVREGAALPSDSQPSTRLPSGGPRRGAGAAQRPPRRGDSDVLEVPAVYTDSQGHFALPVPHAGAWQLMASARGYRQQSYLEHGQFWAGVVLTTAQPQFNVSFSLTRDAAVSGTILDEAGEAVRNAHVRVDEVLPDSPNEGLSRGAAPNFANTDDRGHYEVVGLASGEYRVSVTAQPWYAAIQNGAPASARSGAPADPSLDVLYPETWYPGTTEESLAQTLKLVAGEERQIDLHLTPVPSIHLHIPVTPAGSQGDGVPMRDGPAPQVTRDVRFFGGIGQQVTSRFDGKEWDIGGLTPGSYQVRAAGYGTSGSLSRITVGAGSPSVIGFGAAAPATTVTLLVDGVDDSEVRQITLMDADTHATYRTNRRGPRRDQGSGDDAEPGGPRTILAPAGRYEVYLGGSPGLYLTGVSATDAKAAGRTVVIAGGSPKLTVHAAIGLAEVSGTAVTGGKPVCGAMVLLIPAAYGQPQNVSPVKQDETNTDGTFQLTGVFPGEYILVAIDHGWDVNWHDDSTLARYLAEGTPLTLRGSATVHKEIEAVAP